MIGLPEPGTFASGAVVTIGSFDGVHRGHQHLARRVAADAGARGATAVALTFDPHPRCVVDPAGCPPLLTSVEERTGLLRTAGIEHTAVIRFTQELSEWSATRFCDALVESMPVRRLVTGPGFALGHGREGDMSFLRSYGGGHGFDVVVVPPLQSRGRRISSGLVRDAVRAGRVGEARTLLGRYHRISGVIEHGDGRGASLGFPTANLAVDASRCVPGFGVYACRVLVDDHWHDAATSIGVRPTFAGSTPTVEAFLLDFQGDLYGRTVRMEFVARLRGERRFSDTHALVAQMHRDVENARRRLGAAVAAAR